MTQTPDAHARPVTRLYCEEPLAEGAVIGLAAERAHFLRTVLRLDRGAVIALFNARDGEFLAGIDALGKGWASVKVGAQRRAPEAPRDLWLAFAPLKRQRTDWVVEKATELGVSRLIPVITRHTRSDTVRTDRFATIALEAAEQCERLDLPEIAPPAKLDAVLEAWPKDRPLIFCAEAGESRPIAAALADLAGQPAGLLIGPEGGFSPDEHMRLRAAPMTVPVALGPRVLRADTAALAALSCFQALAGDWTDASARPNFAARD